MAKWDGAADFAACIEESVGHKPWFDYYRTMFSEYKDARSGYTAFKLGSTATNMAREAWALREEARLQWTEHFGGASADWPLEHPPLVLWLPIVGWGACLGCTWLQDRTGGKGGDVKTAAREARKHALDEGADPTAVRTVGVPTVYRDDGPPPPNVTRDGTQPEA
jgi:hypothetical protein